MSMEAERAIDAALDARDSGRAEDGVPLLQAALARHPGYARLWQVLGLLHRVVGDGGAAAEAFGKAAALAPQDAKIAHSLAQSSLEAGFPALAHFERAQALAPGDGEVRIGRAAAQLAEGAQAQAIADLDAILAANPLWLPGHRALVNFRALAGQRDTVAAIERALGQAPGDASLWVALLDSLFHADRFADADAALARARAAGITGLDAFESVIASELGDVERADRLFAALGEAPETAMVVRHIRHLLKTGRVGEAAARIEPLLARPDAEEAWPYAALIWRLTGDPRWEWLEGDARLVGVYDLGARAGDLAALAECLRTLHLAQAEPLGQSVRSGTQTDGPLFMRADPEIRTLRAAIVDAVEAHKTQLPPPDPRHPLLRHRPERVRFAGSWSVRLTGAGGGRHSNHIHPQGWLSSAFYVAVPDADTRGPAPAGWLTLGEAPAELKLDLPALREIEPKPGRLVLFPSLMWHGTRPFAAGERLTVAFDVAR